MKMGMGINESFPGGRAGGVSLGGLELGLFSSGVGRFWGGGGLVEGRAGCIAFVPSIALPPAGLRGDV